MKIYGFIYENVISDDYQEAGCASASTEVYATKDAARAAMLEDANAEIANTGEGLDALAHCEDHIWLEALSSYWTLFEAELIT